MLVKICGLLQPADALVAVEAGADLVGMVFVPGRRRCRDIPTAQSLMNALRNLDASPPTVGLFADQPLEEVNRIVRDCELDMVQLCGHESLEYCDQVEVPAIKVLHILPSWEIDHAVGLLAEQIESHAQQGHWITLDRPRRGATGRHGAVLQLADCPRTLRPWTPFPAGGRLGPIQRSRRRNYRPALGCRCVHRS